MRCSCLHSPCVSVSGRFSEPGSAGMLLPEARLVLGPISFILTSGNLVGASEARSARPGGGRRGEQCNTLQDGQHSPGQAKGPSVIAPPMTVASSPHPCWSQLLPFPPSPASCFPSADSNWSPGNALALEGSQGIVRIGNSGGNLRGWASVFQKQDLGTETAHPAAAGPPPTTPSGSTQPSRPWPCSSRR